MNETSVMAPSKQESGTWDFEMRQASPENGRFQVLARVAHRAVGIRYPAEQSLEPGEDCDVVLC